MKQLKPIILKPEYYEQIEKTLNDYWFSVFYSPIIQIIKESTNLKVKLNSKSALNDALISGRVQYFDGVFSGSFNSKIVKEFLRLGAVYNKNKGTYSLILQKLPLQLQSSIVVSQNRFKRMNDAIVDHLGNIDDNFINESIVEIPIESKYLAVTSKLDKDFIKTTQQLAIGNIPKQSIAENLASSYSENMKIYIKNWTSDNILSLREQVYQNTFAGSRADKLVNIIQKNYNISLSKAKFLSRQETSLLTSKFRQERYQDAGINQYKWRIRGFNTRADHKRLDGKVIDWNNPPITNRETGSRNHAGEDFNCFCIAIPIVRF